MIKNIFVQNLLFFQVKNMKMVRFANDGYLRFLTKYFNIYTIVKEKKNKFKFNKLIISIYSNYFFIIQQNCKEF